MIKTMRYSKTTRLLTVALLSASVLAGCATPLPKPQELPDFKDAQQKAVDAFQKEQVAIERVRVPKSSMKPMADRPEIPAGITDRKIELTFPADHGATLDGLVLSLASQGLQVTFQWSDPTQGEDILKKKLPFLHFEGTIGELMASLRNGLGLVSWYQDGMIYISDKQRYTVTVPQNEDILKALSDELKSMGADNIVTSLRGGKLIYTASPTVQDDLIGPFMVRMARNLSVINMQVAVVSLALNDKSESGFDWDAFRIAFDSTSSRMTSVKGTGTDTTTGTGTGTGTGTDTGTGSGSGTGTGTGNGSDADAWTPSTVGNIISATGGALALGRTSTGSIFGTYGALNISSAIKFLSNFGHTNVTQNVSLKTLSGSSVAFQSGQEVPYVSGVDSNSYNNNSNSTYGSTKTDKVETGLKLDLKPLYDGDSELVTIDVKVDLNQILQFVELSAGNDIGTLTQPLVQKQNLSDLVQVQAGRTVVIGGLQYDSDTFSGNEPSMIRDKLAELNKSIGKRSRETQRNALFIIMRPAVTVYEAE